MGWYDAGGMASTRMVTTQSSAETCRRRQTFRLSEMGVVVKRSDGWRMGGRGKKVTENRT